MYLVVCAKRRDSNHSADPRSLIKAFSFRVYNLLILGTLNVKIEMSDRFSPADLNCCGRLMATLSRC